MLTRCMIWLAVLSVASAPAYAYIDPASGSLVLQIVLGGLAGLLVGWKFFWHKIKSWFVREPKA